MPLPHFHSCRLRNPSDFQPDSFRTVTRDHNGKEYDVIMGRLKDKTTMTEQAYRYKKDIWSASEARSHCEKHNGSFEPAKDDKKSQTDHLAYSAIRIDDKESKKEVIMNIKELQEQYPSLYQEIIDLGKVEGKKEISEQVTSLQVTIAAKDKQIEALTIENQKLDKELIIEKSRAKAEKETARVETIMLEILADSTIDEKLYPKVKKMVDHTKFRIESGDFDENAFKEAFKAEVETWHVPEGGGIGLNEEKQDHLNTSEQSAYGNENAQIAAGFKKS